MDSTTANLREPLPDDVRPDFEKSYGVSFGGMPSIQQIMALLSGEQDTPTGSVLWNYLRQFEYPFDEQIEALLITRRRLFITRRSQLPYQTRHTLATLIKKAYHLYSIRGLFVDNGCARAWWMHPLKPVKSQRMTKVMGWLDGILLYAPEQELDIISAVCEDILRKPGLANEIRTEVTAILTAVSDLSKTHAPMRDTEPQSKSNASQVDQDVQSSRTHQQHLHTIIEKKTRRLRHLETREAVQGIATDPKDRIEIEDLRQEISALELELRQLDLG